MKTDECQYLEAAAIFFDPSSEQDLLFAMRDLLLNPALRLRMERLGVQRAAMFNWESTAAKTLDLYYAIAGKATGAGRAKGAPVPATKSISAVRG